MNYEKRIIFYLHFSYHFAKNNTRFYFYRPSGEAIAEFSSKESAEAAMKMNKEYLGERFVVLTAIDF